MGTATAQADAVYGARMDEPDDEWDSLRAACTRWLGGHGSRRDAAAALRELPPDIEADRYGEGGVVEELESTVAELLDQPAAAFFPSGTMAQQIALRIHADRRGRRTVLHHPACHLDRHEDRAYERLHGLVGRAIGDRNALVGLSDLEEVDESPAALLLELPQRDLGGQLPDWDDLVGQCAWARERGAAVHLDGARLWQCSGYYERPFAEIVALFDTTYVSFYKDLGALSGSCLLGPLDVIAEAREWRRRHGGTLFAMWPYAASALAALRARLPRMPAYRDHALAIAGALRDLDGVRVVPNPPHGSMFHLVLQGAEADLRAAAMRIMREDGVATLPATWATGHPDWRTFEVSVGDATLELSPEECRDLVARLLDG